MIACFIIYVVKAVFQLSNDGITYFTIADNNMLSYQAYYESEKLQYKIVLIKTSFII